MSDTTPQRIIVTQDTPMNYWCSMLNCEEEDLLFALRTIGYSFESVNTFLILNRRKKPNSVAKQEK